MNLGVLLGPGNHAEASYHLAKDERPRRSSEAASNSISNQENRSLESYEKSYEKVMKHRVSGGEPSLSRPQLGDITSRTNNAILSVEKDLDLLQSRVEPLKMSNKLEEAVTHPEASWNKIVAASKAEVTPKASTVLDDADRLDSHRRASEPRVKDAQNDVVIDAARRCSEPCVKAVGESEGELLFTRSQTDIPKQEDRPGKGTGKAPGPAPPKGRGKTPGPPPPSSARGEPSERQAAQSQQATQSLLTDRKRLHLTMSYQAPKSTTVFGDNAVENINGPLLDAFLRGQEKPTYQQNPQQSRPSAARADDGGIVSIIEPRRAMRMEIVLKQVQSSPEQVCACLRVMDLSGTVVNGDDVERLLGIIPTEEDCQQLQMYHDVPERLRSLERMILPFAFVENASERLRLLHIGLAHGSRFRLLRERIQKMHMAAHEVRHGKMLHNVLCWCLQIANQIHHGSLEGATSFAVASFPAFARYRMASDLTALHYLSLTRCNTEFVRELKASLANVPEAARESSEDHKDELQALHEFARHAESFLAVEADADVRVRIVALHQELIGEIATLQRDREEALQLVNEAHAYLGQRKAKPEEFFTHVVQLLRHLEDTAREVKEHPERFQAVIRDAVAAAAPNRTDQEQQAVIQDSNSAATGLPVSVLANGLSVLGAVGVLNDGRQLTMSPRRT